MHNLGSKNWYDKNWRHDVRLGEVTDVSTTWDKGERPAVMPLPVIVGGKPCIEQGERYSERAVIGSLIDGLPQACFDPRDVENPLWFEASAIERCSTQRFYATILNWLAYEEHQLIADAFFAFLGPAAVLTFHENVAQFPDFLTIVHPQFSIIVSYGTRNNFQLALQALQAIVGPTNFGAFGTMPLWYDAATRLHVKLVEDGGDPTKPCLLVGHSYGGAAAAILAARYKLGQPDRDLRYLTFASPKPGDARLRDALGSFFGVTIGNDDDFVPTLPPDLATLTPVMIALGLPAMLVYQQWVRTPNFFRLDPDGSMHAGDYPLIDFTTLVTMMTRIITTLPLIPWASHWMDEYVVRMDRRCSHAEWPIDQEVIDIIESTVQSVEMTAAIVPSGYALKWSRAEIPAAAITALELTAPLTDVRPGSVALGGPAVALGEIELDSPAVPPNIGFGQMLLHTADVPAAALELTYDSPDPDPGTTCLAAAEIEIDHLYEYHHDDTTDRQWFTLELPAGSWRVDITDSSGQGVFEAWTGVCAFLNPNAILTGSGCRTLVAGVGGARFWLTWYALSGSAFDYTFTITSGVCP